MIEKENMINKLCNIRDNFDPTDITDYYGLTNFLFRIINEQENDKEILTLLAEVLSRICSRQVIAYQKIQKSEKKETFMFLNEDEIDRNEKENIYISYPDDIKLLLSRYVIK